MTIEEIQASAPVIPEGVAADVITNKPVQDDVVKVPKEDGEVSGPKEIGEVISSAPPPPVEVKVPDIKVTNVNGPAGPEHEDKPQSAPPSDNVVPVVKPVTNGKSETHSESSPSKPTPSECAPEAPPKRDPETLEEGEIE